MNAMFIDFLAMLLVNMAAGYMLLAAFVLRGLDGTDHRHWVPGFAMVGLIALVFGGVIVTTWPLPGPYNSLYGEFSCLLGIIFLGAALAMSRGWSLITVVFYAFFAGVGAMVAGAAILFYHLTSHPWMSGIGFFLSGFAGIMAGPSYRYMRHHMAFRIAAACVLALIGLIWLATGWPEYFLHMGPHAFQQWVPATMHAAPPK
jgi:putative membrane protein